MQFIFLGLWMRMGEKLTLQVEYTKYYKRLNWAMQLSMLKLSKLLCVLHFEQHKKILFFNTTEHKSLETLLQSFHTRILFSIVWLKPNIVRTAIMFLLIFCSLILHLQAPETSQLSRYHPSLLVHTFSSNMLTNLFRGYILPLGISPPSLSVAPLRPFKRTPFDLLYNDTYLNVKKKNQNMILFSHKVYSLIPQWI